MYNIIMYRLSRPTLFSKITLELLAQALSRGDGPFTRYTLWPNNASIMRIFFVLDVAHLILFNMPLFLAQEDGN